MLPRGAIEPFYEALAWAAVAISVLGVVGIVYAYRRRGKAGEPARYRAALAGPAATRGPLVARRDMPQPLGADELRQAVYHGRVGALMQPVARLAPRPAPLYRAAPCLRDHNGAFLAPGSWHPLAARLDLLGPIDRIVIVRCIKIIRRSRERGLDFCLLYKMATGRLRDPGLIGMLDELVTTHPELGSRLVLELGSARLDGAAERTAARLHRIGIGLCLGRVDVHGLDPAELASRGFGFVRIGTPGPTAGPDAELLQEALAAAGIELVLDRADGEPVPDELLERRLLSEQPSGSTRSSAA